MIMTVAYTSINWIYGANTDFFFQNYTLFSIITAGLKGIKFLIDVVIYTIFLLLLSYFYAKKNKVQR
jgi:hypothetical protein